jgi:GT2 family glycosyltransferase
MPWLSKCLESTKDYAVIAVDNNSNDGTVNFINTNYPEVTLLQQTKNLGFGNANNIGISYALKNGADYVFLLNQDAYLQEGTIEKLIEVHKANRGFGILSPIHLNGSGTNLDKNFASYIKTNDTLFNDALKQTFTKSIYEVPFVNAAAWLLPKATLETVGGFDPIFYHYAEDDNYCQRAIYHKLKIGVVPNIYVRHDREFRTAQNNISQSEMIKRLERSYKHKWANVNINGLEQLHNRKRYLKKLIFKLKLKLRFTVAQQYQKELQLINNIEPKIATSLQKNKIKGLHYL